MPNTHKSILVQPPSGVPTSTRKFALVAADVSTPPVVTAGSMRNVSFTGATITDNADLSGSEQPGLPLGLTIVGGDVILPDDDASYDVMVWVTVACDAADEGALVGLLASGNAAFSTVWVPVHTGLADFTFPLVDYVYAGQTGAAWDCSVKGYNLTVDATVISALLHFCERP